MERPDFPPAAQVAAETEALIFPSFDEGDAWALGRALVDMAQHDALGVVINIRTPNRTLFHAALHGAAPLNDLWAQRKSNTALLFGKSSLEVGCSNREKGQTPPPPPWRAMV
ncbi:MAG: heme-binding protein [Cypionkella sp.]|nr:heme-binding protein [Cypionkella sp.]